MFVRPHQGARVVTINRQALLNALDYRTLRNIRARLTEVSSWLCCMIHPLAYSSIWRVTGFGSHSHLLCLSHKFMYDFCAGDMKTCCCT